MVSLKAVRLRLAMPWVAAWCLALAGVVILWMRKDAASLGEFLGLIWAVPLASIGTASYLAGKRWSMVRARRITSCAVLALLLDLVLLAATYAVFDQDMLARIASEAAVGGLHVSIARANAFSTVQSTAGIVALAIALCWLGCRRSRDGGADVAIDEYDQMPTRRHGA